MTLAIEIAIPTGTPQVTSFSASTGAQPKAGMSFAEVCASHYTPLPKQGTAPVTTVAENSALTPVGTPAGKTSSPVPTSTKSTAKNTSAVLPNLCAPVPLAATPLSQIVASVAVSLAAPPQTPPSGEGETSTSDGPAVSGLTQGTGTPSTGQASKSGTNSEIALSGIGLTPVPSAQPMPKTDNLLANTNFAAQTPPTTQNRSSSSTATESSVSPRLSAPQPATADSPLVQLPIPSSLPGVNLIDDANFGISAPTSTTGPKLADPSPAPIQESLPATGQTVPSATLPLIASFADPQNGLQKSVPVPAAPTAKAAPLVSTPASPQPPAQTLVENSLPKLSNPDLGSSVRSAITRTITGFSEERVRDLSPAVSPSQSPHAASLPQGSGTSGPSSAANKPFADAATSSTNKANPDPAAKSPGPVSPSAPNATAANDTPPTTAATSSPDAQHRDSSVSAATIGPVQSSISVAVPLVAATDAATAAATDSSSKAAANPPNSPAANTPDLPPNPSFAPPGANAATASVQLAQMVNTSAQAEMRIGMNTSSFGSVEVRAVVHAGDIGLQIGSEKGDLRSLLSTEIPGLASTLEQQNLRLAPVSFQQHGFAFTSDLSSGGQSQQRSFSSPFKSNGTPDTPEPFAAASDSSAEAACSIAAGGGLSILA